jgi:hypothetical protein
MLLLVVLLAQVVLPPMIDHLLLRGGYRWISQGLGGLEFGLSKALF